MFVRVPQSNSQDVVGVSALLISTLLKLNRQSSFNADNPRHLPVAPMTVSAVRPWRTALREERCLPASVLGPVLFWALRRLASICLSDVIGVGQRIGFVSA